MATPKLAPALIPKMPESAKGFLNTVCNNKPETASAAPVSNAVVACGNRDSITICCQAYLLTSFPSKISRTAVGGIFTEPIKRLSINRMNIVIMTIMQYLIPFPIFGFDNFIFFSLQLYIYLLFLL